MFDSDLFTNDLAAVFNDWDTATYTPVGFAHPSVNTITVQGIFHYDYIDVNGITTNHPTFRVSTDIIQTPRDGDHLSLTNVVLDQTLNTKDFIVRDYQHWGNGETLLVLQTL
jgi:hypothetical protein